MINLLTGDGREISEVLLADPALAGIHFTGSSATFQHLWQQVGSNIAGYASYPRLVGETGGKDFVLAHPSADVDVLRTALVRGRVRVPGPEVLGGVPRVRAALAVGRLRDDLADEVNALSMGDVADFGNFLGAVIDQRAFDKLAAAQRLARAELDVIAGGTADDSVGYFVRPTVAVGTDPTHEVFRTEYFGPLLALHVYDDERLRDRADPGRRRIAVRADRRGDRPRPGRGGPGDARRCASRPATSTSTTSRPARWSASSRSAAGGPAAPTTRRARCSTCCAGSARARSRRRSYRRPVPATRTRAEVERRPKGAHQRPRGAA